MTPAELAERLEVPPDHVDSLNRRLIAMERDGQLLPNRKGVLLLASKLDLIAGRVQGHRDGFGFLLPDAGGPDVFLSPRQMQKAMHGDRVLVKQTGYDSRGRPEGRIVEVTERANRRLVGRFLNERGVNIVVPEDQRIKHDIVIPPGDTHHAQHGQVVSVEIVDPPANGAPPIGRVVEVLGEIEDPGMEIEIAVRKFDVPHEFSAPALEAAAALPGVVRPADLRGRVDLRDVPLVTIDGEDARDFDDAVYCEPIEVSTGGESVGDAGADDRETAAQRAGGATDGADTAPSCRRGRRKATEPGFRLIVAIADVSHYVKPGAPLDADAAERSTSVYFPRRVIPMLPEKLSNGLCSLNPQVDRLVLVCDMVIDGGGRIRAYQFYDAVMHSAARLTYDEVWAMLSGGPNLSVSPHKLALAPQLRNLHDLYRVLAGARERRGAMEIETVETQIVCDPAGRIERIVPRGRNDAHRLIEECMLAANVCAADFMHRSRHPGLYRIHEGPTPEKLQVLREFLRTVGLSLGGGESPSPRDYAALAGQMRARPDHLLLQTMLLRSMQQAVYSPENVGHFGLAYDAYAHFTSPIRRYPDLMTHRVIKALLKGERHRPLPFDGRDEDEAGARGRKGRNAAAGAAAGRAQKGRQPDRTAADLQDAIERWHQWGMRCSANERRADEASRDVEAWLKCMYMRERVGEQFAGRITGVAPFGVFVTLDELYVEGMVHVSELGGEYFQYSESGHELRGERTGRRFRLTDPIDVQVSRVDLEARRIEFRLVQRTDFRSLERDRQRGEREEARAAREGARRASKAGGRRTGEADADLPALPLPPEPDGRRKTGKTGKSGNPGKTGKAKDGAASAKPGKRAGKAADKRPAGAGAARAGDRRPDRPAAGESARPASRRRRRG
ncbi:ribonuclease R [Burkholderiaceae bacterium FT117]|uniref:ribonuclease R family protein n=1 Tax=Zeimonas sediminis TaxID=2944268 RepID=UPI0023430C66|nr:ribonuclease R [Zeimonas sediminis]MCM5571921.1 ribonuclease R [Zeimonas sediminis]